MRRLVLGAMMLGMAFGRMGAATAAETPSTKATPSATASSGSSHPSSARHAAAKKKPFQRAQKASQRTTPTATTTN